MGETHPDGTTKKKIPRELAIIKYMETQLWLLREMCMDVKKVLESEEDLLDDALKGTEQAVEDIEDATQDITKAIKYQSKHRKKKICGTCGFMIAIGIVLLVLGLKGFLNYRSRNKN